jgi:hypothetical protein
VVIVFRGAVSAFFLPLVVLVWVFFFFGKDFFCDKKDISYIQKPWLKVFDKCCRAFAFFLSLFTNVVERSPFPLAFFPLASPLPSFVLPSFPSPP